MKNKIVSIDDRMSRLTVSMQKISELTNTIDSNLYVKRKEITKLDIVNRDLQKLNKLCEFPKILKEDLEKYHKICKQD